MITRLLHNKPAVGYVFIIIAVGFIVFSNGFYTGFRGDDMGQIVHNAAIRDLSSTGQYFTSSTFYDETTGTLQGQYYRPLMTLTFALIYRLWGLQPLWFHVVQTAIYVTAVVFLFLILSFSVRKRVALGGALIFLVHPLNSQTVYSTASMQDALCLLFGLAMLWSLIRFRSLRGLCLSMLFLALALLSKEAGLYYLVVGILYGVWFDRKRFKPMLTLAGILLAAYGAVRFHAVGFGHKAVIAPIGHLPLWQRLFSTPDIWWLYLSKIVWPFHLSSGYYWVNTALSLATMVRAVLVATVIGGFARFGKKLTQYAPKGYAHTYWLYFVWFVIGLLGCSQLFPMDMTAAETWFTFAFVGVVGMASLDINQAPLSLRGPWRTAGVVVLVLLLGSATYMRAYDWRSAYTLASADVRASRDNYIAHYELAEYYIRTKDYARAQVHAQKSVDIFPTAVTYNALGMSQFSLKDYAAAYTSYHRGLEFLELASLYTNLSILTAYYGQPQDNRVFLQTVTKKYPALYAPWYYLALVDLGHFGDFDEGRRAAEQAVRIGPQNEEARKLLYAATHHIPITVTE